MTVLLAAVLAGAVALPHVVDLRGVMPATAGTLWLASLVLRALSSVSLLVYLVVYLPGTEVGEAVSHWCWHTVLPLLATHLGLDGHRLGEAAVVLTAGALAVSLFSVLWGLWRAARAVQAAIRRTRLGPGPLNSVIVGERNVVFAVAGLARPQIVVSTGALTALDDEELAAGLDHERGHIERRHRYVLLIAELCRAIARCVPGTRTAVSELAFHLERDADRWALSRNHDSLALASAICKAATSRLAPESVVLAGLGGGKVCERLDELTAEASPPCGRRKHHCLRVLAVGMCALAVTLAASLPAAVAAGVERGQAPTEVRHCA